MQEKRNMALAIVANWFNKENKTFFTLPSKRKQMDGLHVKHRDIAVNSNKSAQHFGVMLDSLLSFKKHADCIGSKPIGKIK